MPFQVTYSVKRKPGVIIDFATDEDFFTFCSTQIELHAEVIGDTYGHLFEWDGPFEGTDIGVNVTESDFTTDRPPDSPSGGWVGTDLFYVNDTTVTGAQFDNKRWRFYIDRGTPFEQHDDIIVFGGPFSPHFSGASQTSPAQSGLGLDIQCREPRIVAAASFALTPNDEQPDTVCDSADSYVIAWSAPTCDRDKLVEYELQEKTSAASGWQTIQTFAPSDPLTYSSPQLNANYRVIARYFDGAFSETVSKSVFTNPSPRIKEAASLYFAGAAQQSISQVTNYDFIVRTKLEQQFSSDFFTGADQQSISQVTNYNFITRTKIEQQFSSDFFTGADQQSISQVTGYSVIDRDGTQIGG